MLFADFPNSKFWFPEIFLVTPGTQQFVLFIYNYETLKFTILQINIKQISYKLCNLQVTVLPAKSDSEVMFCLQSYHGLRIDRSFVY